MKWSAAWDVRVRDVQEILITHSAIWSGLCYLPESILHAWDALGNETEKAKQKISISHTTSTLKHGR